MSDHAAPVDAPVTGAMDNDPIVTGMTEEQCLIAWEHGMGINGVKALVPPGMVIAPAGDCLTKEDRAAIGFVVRCLKEVCCDPESPHYLNEEGAEIARRVEAIAAGGTE